MRWATPVLALASSALFARVLGINRRSLQRKLAKNPAPEQDIP
jgi:hypothetical protein